MIVYRYYIDTGTPPVDVEQLRMNLHRAIDTAIDDALSSKQAVVIDDRRPESIRVTRIGEFGSWSYQWPDLKVEDFQGEFYEVVSSGRTVRLRLGTTQRRAWDRLRGRVVVFLHDGDFGTGSDYPLTEFVETDGGTYAATVPDPARPRGRVKDPRMVPDNFRRGLRRTDEVFDTVRDGPSLRFVVAETATTDMIRFALWVASVRGRL
jgi:hypothetical protein